MESSFSIAAIGNMRIKRVLQWVGLLGTLGLILVLAWPDRTEPGLHITGTGLLDASGGGAIPLVITTDQSSGRLVFSVRNAAVPAPENEPEAKMGLAIAHLGGGITSVVEGLGVQLFLAGPVDGGFTATTQRDLEVTLETSGGNPVAVFRIPASAGQREVAVKW